MVRLKPNPKGRSTRIERVGIIDDMDHQGYRVASAHGKGFTVCANSGGPEGKSGFYMVKRTIRKLTAQECARMQGFPQSFVPHPNEQLAKRQFGNSVAVRVVCSLAGSLAAHS
jgi:DNA (cytosine-5)-methyltransferase 1